MGFILNRMTTVCLETKNLIYSTMSQSQDDFNFIFALSIYNFFYFTGILVLFKYNMMKFYSRY